MDQAGLYRRPSGEVLNPRRRTYEIAPVRHSQVDEQIAEVMTQVTALSSALGHNADDIADLVLSLAGTTSTLNAIQSIQTSQGATLTAQAAAAADTQLAIAGIQASLAALQAAMAMVPNFVSTSTMTVENLLVNYPAGTSYRGKYARVTNYGGYVDRVVRCDYDQGLNYHFWTPTQPEYGRSMAATADITLKRLLSPQSVVLTGTIPLNVTRKVTIETTNARPGEIVEIKAGLTSLLGALNILGTGLGSGVSLLLGGYQKYLIDGSSGSLQLVRLV